MIRLLRLALLAVLALCLVTFALANRGPVAMTLFPDQVAALFRFNLSVELPLFVAVFGGVAAGLLIGFVWEWLREHRHRANASDRKREIARLERELTALRGREPKDEILALLERKRAEDWSKSGSKSAA